MLSTDGVQGDLRTEAAAVPGVFWFTGMSGAGKTTISTAVASELRSLGVSCLVFDGDDVRRRLCSDLGYSMADRTENIRRVCEMVRLCAEQKILCLCAFITPLLAMRQALRENLGGLYHEIHVHSTLEECMRRDPKRLYARATSGQIASLTGLGSPYEPPVKPDLFLPTVTMPLDQCVCKTVQYIWSVGALPK
jgi:adenylyl-sulfate kinase